MHLLVRETHDIDAQAVAEDLGHAPTDLVLLSFTDSDLLGLTEAHDGTYGLRATSLARLRHPMSVDLYLDDTLSGARCIVVRLLGGVEYWRYGVEELAALCRREKIALAFLGGDARPDPELARLSTVPQDAWTRLDGFFREGGARNLHCALTLMKALAGLGADDGARPEALPACGVYRSAEAGLPRRALVVFYRAHVLAADLAGIDALVPALAAHGIGAELVYVSSLKDRGVRAWLGTQMEASPPDIILNATFFAARGDDGEMSILEQPCVPVLQLLQPGCTEEAWRRSSRGLSQSDLAMQVVLPELDGRLIGPPVSFREAGAPGLPARRLAHAPGIAHAAMMASRWLRLARKEAAQRDLALVLSDYPGAEGQAAHAVGLDGFASLAAITRFLHAAGYDVPECEARALVEALCHAPPRTILTEAAYEALFATLPAALREAVTQAWGRPSGDIVLRFAQYGRLRVAVQPDRGCAADRKAQYHDPDAVPSHAYLGFYLWLRCVCDVDAMVHLGTHGTLEWMPGKASALSEGCTPSALLDGLPVIYPFIVNNPGEAAAARRRLGAVVVGHMTPPVRKAGLGAGMAELERLIDEYAQADGLDRRRGAMLRKDILKRAGDLGVLAESGVAPGQDDEAEALARLDAYLCDVKDLQIRDGLHIFGETPPRLETLTATIAEAAHVSPDSVALRLDACPLAERRGLLEALDGRFVPPGPAGAPTRGRLDVLPTGRNLTSVDSRQLPTRAAQTLARAQAELILTRHLQEEGEPLRHLVLDLWGSATLRTGGEEMALALLLMGVVPQWDNASGRVSGFEIVPLGVLDRPRVDVTLRISGLFRDAFPGLISLFDQAVRAVAAREEDVEWNPLSGQDDTARIFGAAPGTYGTGVEEALVSLTWDTRDALGRAYLDGSAWVYGGERDGAMDRRALEERMRMADAILHVQDHAETDLLDGADNAAHEGGLAAAAEALGTMPRIWHGDTSNPDAPKLRDLEREIARTVRGRLTNPQWIDGMMRHGYRGAAEMARGVEALCGFAATLSTRFDGQFDLVFAAMLDDAACDRFLREANPGAHEDIRRRLAGMWRRGLWRPRANHAAGMLER